MVPWLAIMSLGSYSAGASALDDDSAPLRVMVAAVAWSRSSSRYVLL